MLNKDSVYWRFLKMSKISYNLRLLCNLQGNLFSHYRDFCSCSPYVFIRRFMNSNLSRRFDNQTILLEQSSNESFVEELNEEYGETKFGKPDIVKREPLYWVGYLYRYWANTRNVSSSILYANIKPDKLVQRYFIYHSMDLDYAIDRIIEEEGISFECAIGEKDIMEVIEEYINKFGLEK